MSLIDDIERLGRAAEAGEITKDSAARALVAASEGGLTSVGAAGLIATWGTTRATYQAILADADKQLAAVNASASA